MLWTSGLWTLILLTQFSQEIPQKVISIQCRPRSDSADVTFDTLTGHGVYFSAVMLIFVMLNELLCPPTMAAGHIVFSADPVGVGVVVGIAFCPHSISLLNGHILAKLTQIYHWEGEKCWLDFGDFDPIFKVTGGLRLLENGLSASYLFKEWIDFNQTCTSIFLGHVKELIRFWWPWYHFQGHRRA